MSAVELARQEWEEGFRRLQSTVDDRPLYGRVWRQVEVVIEELRRRVGATYTLAELTNHYHGADRWATEAIGERSHGQEWVRSASTAADAAFHLYSRGARDYRP